MTASPASLRPSAHRSARSALSALLVGRRVLRANAVFSFACGLAALVGASPLAHLLGAPTWVVAAAGPGLLGYGAIAWKRASEARSGDLFVFAAADGAWVVATVMLLVGFPSAVRAEGKPLLVVLAVVVGVFEVLQAWAATRARSRG